MKISEIKKIYKSDPNVNISEYSETDQNGHVSYRFAKEEFEELKKTMQEAEIGPQGVLEQGKVMERVLEILTVVYEKGATNGSFEVLLAGFLAELRILMTQKTNKLLNACTENNQKAAQMFDQLRARARMGELSSSKLQDYKKEVAEACDSANKEYEELISLFYFTYWDGVCGVLDFYMNYSKNDPQKVPGVFVVLYESVMDQCEKNIRDLCNLLKNGKAVGHAFSKAYDTIGKLYERKDKWEKQQEIEAYWKEHPEEKKELEERIADLKNELAESRKIYSEIEQKNRERINELEKKKKTVLPEEQELSQLEDLIFDKSREHSKMGIFAGKKKKLLAEEIKQLQEKQVELKKNTDNVREKYNAEIGSELSNLKGEINGADKKVKQLTSEIDKIQKQLERTN